MKNRILGACLALFLLSPLPALASLYVGGSIGNSWFTEEVTVDSVTDEIGKLSSNSTGWKLFGGFTGDGFLGLEGGYRDLGTVDDRIEGFDYKSQTKGWDVEATGRLKIAMVDIFAKAGAFFWETQNDALDESGTAFIWGLGAGVRLGAIGVRLEWEAMEVKVPDSLTMLSLGVTLGF